MTTKLADHADVFALSPFARVYWDGVAAGELRLQQCDGCGCRRHPPTARCARCGSFEWSIVRSRGVGTVHSWVIPRRPALPSPPAATGRIVLLVELVEGVRVLGHLAPDQPPPVIGAPIVLTGIDRSGEFPTPLFREARGD